MPVPPGSRLDPDATRQRILDAASRLFLARGVHAVGVSDIAAAANASKLSLYKFFPSKRALVGAVVAERSDHVHRWLRDRTGDADLDGPDGVLAVFDLLAGWYQEADFTGCAIVNTAVDTRGDEDDAVAAVSLRHLERYRDLFAERLRWLKAPSRDKARLVRQLLVLIEGGTVVSLMDRRAARQVGRDARAAAEALVEGLAARSPRPAASTRKSV